jgi:hypothetical protein
LKATSQARSVYGLYHFPLRSKVYYVHARDKIIKKETFEVSEKCFQHSRQSHWQHEFRIVFFRCWRIERQGQEEGEVTCSQTACCWRCTCYFDWIMVGVCVKSTILVRFHATVPNMYSWLTSYSQNLRKPKKDKPIAIEDKKKKKKGLASTSFPTAMADGVCWQDIA